MNISELPTPGITFFAFWVASLCSHSLSELQPGDTTMLLVDSTASPVAHPAMRPQREELREIGR